jgi:hypothetical protein
MTGPSGSAVSAAARVGRLARVSAARALYAVMTTAAMHPALALPLARLRREGELVEESTDLLIESFPRCASSFAVAAFRLAQEPRPVTVAYQTHAPGHVIRAVRLGVPALVLTREPGDVVVSNLIRHPKRGVDGVIHGFLRFYEPLMPYRSGFVAGTFAEVVGGRFGAVICRVNHRFGTSFAEFEATEANVNRCLREIDEEWRRRRGDAPDRLERIVPRPSETREGMKEDLRRRYDAEGSPRLRTRAEALYRRLAG